MPTEVVGRQSELDAVGRFFDRPADRLSALVFEGQPGIGKSTLWRAAVETAREHGLLVLVSQPAEAEQSLPNVVLGDLLGNLPREVVEGLPEPRRRALDAALLRGELTEPVDPLALNVAVWSALAQLAERGRLAIAVDDDQWLDAASRAALAFALRRLSALPIAVVLARRAGKAEPQPLEAGLDDQDVERLAVGPLSFGAVQRLVADRLGVALRRRDAIRIHETSGGNPFYALELARAASSTPSGADPAAPLPLPPTLEAAVADRLDGLDVEVTELMLLVALSGRVPATLGERLGFDDEVLRRAMAARLLERAGGAIIFTHPLLAAAVYRRASDAERRAGHARLATSSDDPVERARHLALAAAAPDDALSSGLEAQATAVWQRGQAFAAAELADHALRLTPPRALEARHRRTLFAARAHLAAGNADQARALSGRLLAEAPAGAPRARALLLASELAAPGDALALLERALVEAGGAAALEAETHAALAAAGRIPRGRVWAEEHAEKALALLEALDDEALRATVLSVVVWVRFDRGAPDTLALAQRAYDIGRALGDGRVDREGAIGVAHQLAWTGALDRARAFIEGELVRWSDRDEEAREWLLWYLALVELWAGHWDIAESHARASAAIAEEYDIELPQRHLPLAMLALHRGDFDAARAASRRALTLADEGRLPSHLAVLATADAWSGQTESALEGFARAEAAADARGQEEPALRDWRAEYLETLVRAGRMDEAAALLDPWEAAAKRLGRRRQVAQALRARADIAAARGDILGAIALLEEAVEAHAVAGDPFGQARASLALGGARRRVRQKASARAALETALAAFETLGAASWADVAREELARIGGRHRIAGLSASELRVAELVAAGRTNREIAQALYLGERTVASHLTHVYSKLGIRSRTELAHRLLSTEPGESASQASKVPTS